MKSLSAFIAVYLLAAAASGQSNPQAQPRVQGRTTYHKDGTRTESVRDPYTGILTEKTFNSHDDKGVLVSRAIYQLDSNGQVTQGMIYDGRDNLQASARMISDDFGRPKESILTNLNGEIFQRTIYEYGPDGKPKKSRVVNYNVATPSMKPAVIDFTKTTSPVTASSADAPAPAGGSAQALPPTEEKPKRSFWSRLFGGKKKEEKK